MIPGAPVSRSNVGRFVAPPAQTSRYTVSGVTLDTDGAALGGCTVTVFESVSGVFRGTTISDDNGNWAVEIAGDGTVAVEAVAYLQGPPDVFDVSVNTMRSNAAWTVAFSDTFTTNEAGWGDYTMRQLFDPSQLTGSGSSIRLTIETSSAQACIIDKLYVGHQSSAANFDGNQVQLFNNGSSLFTFTPGVPIRTDSATFAYDRTRGLIVSAHFDPSGLEALRYSIGVGTNYYKGPAIDEAAQTTVTGYTVVNSRNYLSSKIEVI